MICSIYKIINSINDKVYIGQTWQTIHKRFAEHKNRTGCVKLYNAFNKYGRDNFSIEVVCYAVDQLDADYWERHFIRIHDSINNGYNIREGGSNGKMSDESKKKISDANRGENNGMFGKEAWNKGKTGIMPEPWNKGKLLLPLSDKTKAKIGISNIGKHSMPKTNEQKAKISLGLIGKKLSDETRRKMSEAAKGKPKPLFKNRTWKIINGVRVWMDK